MAYRKNGGRDGLKREIKYGWTERHERVDGIEVSSEWMDGMKERLEGWGKKMAEWVDGMEKNWMDRGIMSGLKEWRSKWVDGLNERIDVKSKRKDGYIEKKTNEWMDEWNERLD